MRVRERLADRSVDRGSAVAVDVAHHVPSVGFEPPRGVFGEPAPHVAVDGDVVVVVERDQLAEAQRPRQRAGLVRYAFHEAAVAEKDPRPVVDDHVPRSVETRGQHPLRDRHSHRIRDSLSQGSGGGLHTGRIAVLGVARSHRAELAEARDLVQRQRMAAEVEQRIEEHRSVPVRDHESVAIRPGRIGGIMLQVVVPQHLGDVGHSHRHPRVAGARALNSVHRKRAHRVCKFSACRHG